MSYLNTPSKLRGNGEESINPQVTEHKIRMITQTKMLTISSFVLGCFFVEKRMPA